MSNYLRCMTFLALIFTALCVRGASPEAAPESAGMSSERLARLDATLQQAVDSGELPGAVVMIVRNGKLVHTRALGWQDRDAKIAMRSDSIFRVYSMTKPIVSVAAMMLLEEGRLGLHEPVSKFIPEFKEMKVGVEAPDASGKPVLTLVNATRQITVQDLLRHTSGLTYGVLGAPNLVKKAYLDAGIFSQKWVLADFCRALAKLPLQYDPGSTWEYGHSTDVLGRVVEVASGQSLDVFLAEKILRPLKMNDTGFHVPREKHNRIAQPIPDKYTGKTPELLDLREPATFFAGGHGLVSTAEDYMRFTRMLLNGGELDGVRILGPRTLRNMSSNHINDRISRGNLFLPGPGYGFGLGFGTRIETGQSEWPGSIGDFYWGGFAGTAFWVDPAESMAVVYMSQEPLRRAHYRTLLRALVYQAIMQ
ncbi:MAG: serine hydrolase domain-containing protein [Burkholderiales bacterium]